MPLSATQVRAMMRVKRWTNVDLAAHWGHGVSYVSWLINNPLDRPRVYDDAFRGLPDRDKVEVTLEARHRQKPRLRKWTVADMYPVGRVFVTQNSRLGPEEGIELAVKEVRKESAGFFVQFEILSGDDAGEFLEIEHGVEADGLSDTGQDRRQRTHSG